MLREKEENILCRNHSLLSHVFYHCILKTLVIRQSVFTFRSHDPEYLPWVRVNQPLSEVSLYDFLCPAELE